MNIAGMLFGVLVTPMNLFPGFDEVGASPINIDCAFYITKISLIIGVGDCYCLNQVLPFVSAVITLNNAIVFVDYSSCSLTCLYLSFSHLKVEQTKLKLEI